MTYRDSVEMYLAHVEDCRIQEIYKHENCTEECKKRGCGSVWSTDGLWKLSDPIGYELLYLQPWQSQTYFSMCTVTGGLAEDLQSYIPVVCTNSPANGKTF